MNENDIVVFADKTVIKVRGLQIRGLNTREVEQLLTERFGSLVRVIGVTGGSIDMDVYGMDEEQLLRDEAGIIQTLSAAEGITPLEVAELASARRIVAVKYDEIPQRDGSYCARERWMEHENSSDPAHR